MAQDPIVEQALPTVTHDEKSSAGDVHIEQQEQQEVRPRLTPQAIMAVITLGLVYNAYLFTQLMPAVILSEINADIGPDPSFPWITINWNLGAAIIVTVSGRLADIFGRRWFLLTGAAFGALGALIGATGQSIRQMITAGVFMGIGGGFQETIFAAVQEIVPNRYRLFILGCVEASNVPAMLSPILAYVFITYAKEGWRVCYWWAFAFESLAVIALFFFYKPPSFETKHRVDRKTKRQLLGELDYLGLLLFAAGCILLLLGVNWGGRELPWRSAGVIIPIVLSGVAFVALAIWEVKTTVQYPILPPKLFTKWRDFTSILMVTFVGGMLYYSMNVIWPRQSALLFVSTNEPLIQGVYANMFSFGTMLAAILVVCIVPHCGHERWQLVTFLVIETAMIGSMASVGVQDKAQAIATIIIVATSVTPPQYLAYGMISLALESQTDIGVTQGLLCTFRLIGGAIATAIYTAIEYSRYDSVIVGKVQAAATSSGFTGSFPDLLNATATNTLAAYENVPKINDHVITTVQAAVKEANAEAFQLVYEVAVAFGVVAILVSLTTRSIDVKKKSNERTAALENEHEQVVLEKTVA